MLLYYLATFTAVIPLQGSQTRNICNVNNVPGVFYPFILPAITEISSHGNPVTKTTANSSDQVTRPTWTQNLATRPSHHHTQSCVLLLMHSRQWSPHLNSFLHQDYSVEIVANMTFNFAIKNRFHCLHFDGSTKAITTTTAKPSRQRFRQTHPAIANGGGYADNDLQLALPIGEYIDTSILQAVANNNIGKSTQDTVMVAVRYYHLLQIFLNEFWVNLAMTEMNDKQHLLNKKLDTLHSLISFFSDPNCSCRKVDLVTMKPATRPSLPVHAPVVLAPSIAGMLLLVNLITCVLQQKAGLNMFHLETLPLHIPMVKQDKLCEGNCDLNKQPIILREGEAQK